MQRPSHNITTLSLQPASRRFAGASFTILTQLAFVAVLIGGVVVRVGAPPPQPFQVDAIPKIETKTPPPPVMFEKPVMPTAVAPLIDIAPETGGESVITVVPPRLENPLTVTTVTRQPPQGPPAILDRAAIALPQTHTVPPYPSLARRLGVEGKVTLRLTVMPDGTVAKADVVTSSGRPDLDQAAQQWLVAHWTYQPAIRGGAPAASQVMAAVEFSLTSSR